MGYSHALRTHETSARRELRQVAAGGYLTGDPDRGHAAAMLAGAPAYVVAAMEEWAARRSGACPWTDAANEAEAAGRACELAAYWLRGEVASSRQLDIGEALRKAGERMDRCGEVGAVYREGRTGPVYVAPRRCKARACLPCARRAMRRAMARWAALFAVRPRDGWQDRFVTIGSATHVRTDADVRRYLRRVGDVCRVMREGSPRRDIPPGSWVAGLRALEVLPRAEGGYGHVHLYVVRSAAFYPYGYARATLADRPELADTGVRRVLRDFGLTGEVWREEPVAAGADAVSRYMAKVASYMAKVQGEGDAVAEGWAREDIQRALRGARLLQPFGEAWGAFAGPDRTERAYQGRKAPALRKLGTYDPREGDDRETDTDADAWDQLAPYAGTVAADIAGAFDTDDGPDIIRATRYRADTLARWGRWAHVGELSDLVHRPGEGAATRPPG